MIPLLILMITGLSGCGDFFAVKPTEIQSKAILDELSQIRESPHVDNTLPDVYLQPPARLAIKDGIKLFYFTKHHPPQTLAGLVEQQLGVRTTTHSSSNQIVVYCKDDAQATAVEECFKLIDVEPVQVNIDCLILERFGDITMDWETSILVQDLLSTGVTMGEDLATFSSSGELIELDPAFPGASLRETERANFGLDFGIWKNRGVPDEQIRAIVDLLVSRGYLKILLNPHLETINGKQATVTIKDYTPIEEVRTGAAGATGVYNITKYVWVQDTLTVTPHVYSDGSIGLTTDIKIGSRSKPEGVVQRSIITERSINVEENRIEPGKSLIIGGMRKSEKRSVIRGVPVLKDLPLLGILFSSKDFEEKGTEIIFILTPSISSGSVENKKIVEMLRKKHEEPEYKVDLKDILTDPFATPQYTEVLEREATEAELERVQAELDLETAQIQAQTEKERADRVAAQAEQLRQKSEELSQKAKAALEEANKAAEEAKKIKEQSQAEQQKAAELEAQKQQSAQEAQKAQQEAEQAKTQAEEADKKAQQAREESEKARQELEKAQQEAEKTKQETPQTPLP